MLVLQTASSPRGTPEAPAASSGSAGRDVGQRSPRESRGLKLAPTTPMRAVVFSPSPAPFVCVCVSLCLCSFLCPMSVSCLSFSPSLSLVHLCLSAGLWPLDLLRSHICSVRPYFPSPHPSSQSFFLGKEVRSPCTKPQASEVSGRWDLEARSGGRPLQRPRPKGSLGPLPLLVCLTYLFLTCPTWHNKEPAHPLPQGAPFLPSNHVMQEFLVF